MKMSEATIDKIDHYTIIGCLPNQMEFTEWSECDVHFHSMQVLR